MWLGKESVYPVEEQFQQHSLRLQTAAGLGLSDREYEVATVDSELADLEGLQSREEFWEVREGRKKLLEVMAAREAVV